MLLPELTQIILLRHEVEIKMEFRLRRCCVSGDLLIGEPIRGSEERTRELLDLLQAR